MSRSPGLPIVILLLVGGFCLPADAEGKSATQLKEQTVRKIFRIVTGQPQLEDREIGLSMARGGLGGTGDAIWTCVWAPEVGDKVLVIQVRDRDGAYRQPAVTDLSSLKFAIRPDLKERIAALVTEDPEDGSQ